MKNIVKLVLTLALPSILFSCGEDNSSDLSIMDTSVTTSSVSNIESDIVAQQIKTNTITKDEWGTQVKVLPTTKKVKNVTFLSYAAFDNDKGLASYRNELPSVINMHELAGSSDTLNQILLTDTPEKNDTRRYYIINNTNEEKINSPYVLSRLEKDTANYMTLAAFTKWGFSNYPSKVKILDINSHGYAYKGIANDSGKVISLNKLSEAVRLGAGKLDLLIMDACMMSSIEVAYELRNNVDYIVSSEDYTLSVGMEYVKHLPEILAKSKNNDEIAQNIMELSNRLGDSYADYGKEGVKVPNVFTIAAIKASDMDRLVYHLNKLSRMLLNKMDSYKGNLKIAFAQAHKFALEDGEEDNGQRDLYEILARIERNIPDKEYEIKNTIQDAREAANRAMIRARIHNSEKFAEGIAINISNSVNSNEYKATSFAKDTLWDEMVNKVNN